jgi:hypothetical protein
MKHAGATPVVASFLLGQRSACWLVVEPVAHTVAEGRVMAGKRRFGRVRELPSGRRQARYKGPDGIDRPAPHTFDSKASADRWLTLQEAEIIRGDWIDPDAGRVNFAEYAATWNFATVARGESLRMAGAATAAESP